MSATGARPRNGGGRSGNGGGRPAAAKPAYTQNNRRPARGGKGPLLIVAAAVLGIGLFAGISWIHSYYSDAIIKGVMVEGVDVGGMTRDEARSAVEQQIAQVTQQAQVHVTSGDKQWELTGEQLHIESDLLDSEERLSGDELKPDYVHPVTSSMLVDRFPEYPKDVVRAIVEHHERLDGSGYPRGIAGTAISSLGRVLALAEVVTAMFDGERRWPEQRVSLLLRINPRRYDVAHVGAIQRLLASAPASVDGDEIDGDALLARLLRLTEALALWRASSEAIGGGLPVLQAALVRAVDAQNATLQRMLYDAGVTREQLAAIACEVDADASLRIELWAIG
jgi:hypothetical protein